MQKFRSKKSCLCPLVMFFFICILGGSAYSARPFTPEFSDPVVETWRWTAYPFLKDKRTRCVVEDALGNLWFGTDTGVWQYDGQSWGLFGGIGEVRALCVGNNQKLYAGTNTGLWVLKGKEWGNVSLGAHGFPWDVSSLSASKTGILWAGTPWGGVWLKEGGAHLVTTQDMANMLKGHLGHTVPHIVPNSVALKEDLPAYGVLKTGSGQVYWATQAALSAGVTLADRVLGHKAAAPNKFELRIKNRQGTRSLQLSKSAGGPPVNTLPVFDILETQDHLVWLSLSPGQLICFDVRKKRAVEVPSGYVLCNLPRLFEDKDGTLWILSEDESVGIQTFDGQVWKLVALDSQADINLHTSFYQTRDGHIWIGGHQGVVNTFSDPMWQGYSPPVIPLPKVRVADMLQTLDGALWFVSLKQGAMRFDYQTERWISYRGLNFQCETADQTRWFLDKHRSAVRQTHDEWTAWDQDDGLMSDPNRIIATHSGVVWATGAHLGHAATALFVPDSLGGKWQTKVHTDFSWSIEIKAVFEDSKGHIWFGAAVGYAEADGHLGGLLRYDPHTRAWHRFNRPDVPGFIYGIGESRDGTIWVGSTSGLFGFDGQGWLPINEPSVLRDKVDMIHTGPSGTLWVGLRAGDVLAYDGQIWQHFTTTNGLPAGRIRSIWEEMDGRVWVGTSEGYGLYDGKTWDKNVLHGEIPTPAREGILGGQKGIWINQHVGWHERIRSGQPQSVSLYTLFYQPDLQGPNTHFTISVDQIQQPGHAIFEWVGTDAWHITPDANLQYAWRFDGGEWSDFAHVQHYTALSLPDGEHTFEVAARDADLNLDPSPAILHFTVIPPIWRQSWFMVLIGITACMFLGLVYAIYARHKFLRAFSKEQQALQAMSDAIQNMFSITALYDVVKVIYEQLPNLGIDCHTLSIHQVIDADEGKIRTYEIDTCKQVSEREFVGPRVVAMWQQNVVTYRPDMHRDSGGLNAQMLSNMETRMGWPVRSILDMPHARGVLSLHSAKPQGFTRRNMTLVKRVAEYLSLGLTRAEDISRINEALESTRKLAHAVEHSPSSVVITDLRGNIEYVNPRFEEVTGYTMNEVRGRNPRILKSGESPLELYHELWQTIASGEIWRGEFHNKRKNGELYWEAASISGVRNQNGEITHYIAVKEDITKQKEMENALLENERNQVLVATAGAAAHEINQPLTVLLGLTQLLINTVEDAQMREDLGYMEDAGQTIKKIITQMSQTQQFETKDYVGSAKIADFSVEKSAD